MTKPPYVDFKPALVKLTVEDLLSIANMALQDKSLREISDLFFDVGATLDFKMEPKP